MTTDDGPRELAHDRRLVAFVVLAVTLPWAWRIPDHAGAEEHGARRGRRRAWHIREFRRGAEGPKT